MAGPRGVYRGVVRRQLDGDARDDAGARPDIGMGHRGAAGLPSGQCARRALVAHSVRMRAEVRGFGIIPAYTVEIDQPLFALDVDLLTDVFESGDLAAWGAVRTGL